MTVIGRILDLEILPTLPASAEFCSFDGGRAGAQNCAAARASAAKVVFGCDEFRAKFGSKQRALGDSPSHEDMFKALGAEDVGMVALAERLVEGKKPAIKD